MILKIDLGQSYGQQNEDVAKKSKINKVTISINKVRGSDGQQGAVSKQINVTQDNNTTFQTVATNFSSNTGIRNSFSSYIGVVEYKSYTFTLDLTDPEFEILKTANKPVPYTQTYSGNRAFRNMTGYAGNRLYVGKPNTQEGFKAFLEEKDIVQEMANFKYTAAGGQEINLWTSEIDFEDNYYTADGSEHNVASEWSSIIQTASDNITYENLFATLTQYTNTEIIEWENQGDMLTITMKIPYGIYFWQCNQIYNTGETFGFQRIYSADPILFTRYLINSANISFVTSLDVDTYTETFFNGNREYAADSSFMFTEGNKLKDDVSQDGSYAKTFATEIYEAYSNGKLELKINYPVKAAVDIFENPVFYSPNFGLIGQANNSYFDEDGKEITLSDSDKISSIVPITEGSVCSIRKNNQIIYLNDDDKEKYFLVQDSNIVYNGILMNELNLIESTESLPEYVLTTNKTNVVERISSPIAGAPSGALSNGDSIYEGDIITITYTGGVRTYSISMGGTVIDSGSDVSSISQTLTVSGDVVISITAKTWHWVDYHDSGTKTFATKDYTQYGLTWQDTYDIGFNSSIQSGMQHRFSFTVNFYNARLGSTYSKTFTDIPETTSNDNTVVYTRNYAITSDPLVSAGETMLSEFLNGDPSYYVNCLKFNVTNSPNDQSIIVTNIGQFYNTNDVSYDNNFNNYFTAISNITVSQYEYS